MQRQVFEHVNSEITKYINMAQSPYAGIILVSCIATIILPHIKDEAKEYSKQELYNYLKTNFPILSSISYGNRQMLTDMLKDSIDKHYLKKGS